MNKKALLKHLAHVWLYVGESLDSISHTKYGTQLVEMVIEEERDHRRNDSRSFQITIHDAARLISLQWLLRYMHAGPEESRRKLPTVADYLFTKKSCYHAAACVVNYRKQIQAALVQSNADTDAILSADYSKLV